jgi:hypothetical protein
MVLITILALAVLAFVGKLIYDVQQKKNKPTKNEGFGYSKEAFQKLAGIGVPKPDKNTEVINGYKELAEKWAKAGFPEPDVSIPVTSTKITTIDTNFGDNDPLATIPMSRVSSEGKKKMAQIAKEDIKITTEAKANELISKGLVTIPEETKPKRKYKKKATK